MVECHGGETKGRGEVSLETVAAELGYLVSDHRHADTMRDAAIRHSVNADHHARDE